jgi:hypothetical protein
LTIYWKGLSEQFLYRAKIGASFGDIVKSSSLADSLYIEGINQVVKRLNQKLLGGQIFDGSLLKDVESQNDSLTMFLGRLLGQIAKDEDFRRNDEYRNVLSRLEGAEIRIHFHQKLFNGYCERTGREELRYKKR